MTGIDWPAFLLVFVAALAAAVVTVGLFAAGVRLLATPAPGAVPEGEADSDDPGADDPGEDDPTTPAASRPRLASASAVVVFALAAAIAVIGVVLIVH